MDFAKLLARDRLDAQDDHRMVMINNKGYTYWAPYSNRTSQNAVSSYQVWELAFRMFSQISTHVNFRIVEWS